MAGPISGPFIADHTDYNLAKIISARTELMSEIWGYACNPEKETHVPDVRTNTEINIF